MSLERMLVKGRKCGSCSVCCVSLKITEPTLKKEADIPCINLRPQGGCSVYENRPPVCKTWYCGWRLLPFMGPGLRPDRSKVLVRFDGSEWCFQPTDKTHSSAILDEEILTVIGAIIDNDGKVSISIPTKPGYCSANTVVHEHLKEAVSRQSLQQVKRIMSDLIVLSSKAKTDPLTP
ncbi:YkgJ family cysteine cluster protein [Rahnella rivi]|uniref:YkgJ family cysteine cluster protein n=1 Tax=Rahnella rivi TaxID=2816249 RepID=UPI0039BDB291